MTFETWVFLEMPCFHSRLTSRMSPKQSPHPHTPNTHKKNITGIQPFLTNNVVKT